MVVMNHLFRATLLLYQHLQGFTDQGRDGFPFLERQFPQGVVLTLFDLSKQGASTLQFPHHSLLLNITKTFELWSHLIEIRVPDG